MPPRDAKPTPFSSDDPFADSSGSASRELRTADPQLELPVLPGASSRTLRQLEVLENDVASRGGNGDYAAWTVALIAPEGADLAALGSHLISRFRRAGFSRFEGVSVVPMNALAALPDSGASSSNSAEGDRVEPHRAGCVVYSNIELQAVLPIDVERRWWQLRSKATAHGPIGVIHLTSMSAWRAFQVFAADVARLVDHVIELGAANTTTVAGAVAENTRNHGIEVVQSDLLALVEAAETELAQRGVDLVRFLTAQLIGHHARTGRTDVAQVAASLGVRMGSTCDPLSEFVGFDAVSRQLDGITALAARPQLAGGLGAHCVFSGSAGTGKTTAAQALAHRLHRAGVTDRPLTHVVTRADLIGEYLGQTAPLVRAACERARGGVLFVDEAYSLAGSGPSDYDSYGREAVAELVQQMEELRDELVVVLAGYPEPMVELMRSNQGLASRLTHVVEFPDLNQQELMAVFEQHLASRSLRIGVRAKGEVGAYLTASFDSGDFGNARGVRRLVAQLVANWLERTGGQTDRPLTVADLPNDVRAQSVASQPIDGASDRERCVATSGYL